MSIPEGMTPEKLREIADWLDTYDKMAEKYIMLVRGARWFKDQHNAEELLEAVRGKEIQDDLRRWADDLGWDEV